MDFLGGGISKQQTGMDAGYNNYNASGTREDVFVQKDLMNEGTHKLQQIPVGRAFRGEITDIAGDRVTIRLDNGQQVQARLAENMNFNIGDKILFQVKSNAGGTIEIKPVMIALQGQEGAILRALEAANLPVNDKTVALLAALLDEQMPIDKNSIQNLYKQVLANQQADIRTLVTMNKLNIPLTKENIGQFESYRNYEHRIAAQVSELSGQVMELLQEINGENASAGRQFHMELLQFVTQCGKVPQEVTADVALQQPKDFVLNNDIKNADMPEIQQSVVQETQISLEGAERVGNAADEATAGVMESDKMDFDSLVSEETGRMSTDNAPVYEDGQIGSVLTFEERRELADILQKLPFSEELKTQLINGEGRVSDLLEELQIQLQQYTQLDIELLVHSEGYSKLLKAQIARQWFLKPEQLTQKVQMGEFYERLHTQAEQLEAMLSAAGRSDSVAAKTVGGLQDNIDFMNQINQMFTYVQIPLMLSGKAAHSDLYVFTKKKNLLEQEGRVSALLHLDMEELGSLDVYVEMDGMDVKTQFKLANRELVELFEENMDFLTRRITEKGYRFSSKVEQSDEKIDFVEDFLERDQGNTPMQRFTFDVRA